MNDKKTSEFFDKLCEMWEKGESHKEELDNYYGYLDGSNFKNPADSFFNKEKRTNCNMVQQICESKLSAVLDAQFTASVVPEIYAFTDMTEIQNLQAVADVLNTAMKNVLAKNSIDSLKESVGRWGFVKFGASQVSWSNKENDGMGDIVINSIDPRNLKWAKGGKNIKKLPWIGYAEDLDISIAKRDYARNPDGSFDVEFCEKLDEAAGEKTTTTPKDNNRAMGSYLVNGDNPSAGLAFVKETSSKGMGKSVTIVVMFIFDGSMEAPEQNDSSEMELEKQDMRYKYPNGRIITFIPDKEKKIILDDKAAPEAFKSIGNIDIFNTREFGNLAEGGEVEALAPIQERINGCYRKLRTLVGGDISAVLFDEKMRGLVDDSALVNLPVQFIESLGGFDPPVLDNGMIAKAIQLKELIEGYKQEARETGHVNAQWMNGEQQKGINSGDQVDSLNESAMASIRPIQRNFKDYFVSVCEKVVSLIVENYSSQRLIEIATGINQKEYAMFDSQTDEDGKEKRSIKFINDAGQIVKEIQMSEDWKFKVEVSSGTEIPRSRRENSRLVDEVAASPIMQSGNMPMIEMYLTAKDFPNRRALIDIMKKQQEQAAKNPTPIKKQLLSNPQLLTAVGAFFKDLTGFPNAQGAILKEIGYDGTTGTITSLPASEVTSKSSAKDLAIIAPSQISEHLPQAQFGHQQATDLEVIQHKEEKPKMAML